MSLDPLPTEYMDPEDPKTRVQFTLRKLTSVEDAKGFEKGKTILFINHPQDLAWGYPDWEAGLFNGVNEAKKIAVTLSRDHGDSYFVGRDPSYKDPILYEAIPNVGSNIAAIVKKGKLPAGVEIELAEMLTGKRPKSFLPPRKQGGRTRRAKGRKYRKQVGRPLTHRARSFSQ